MRLIILLFFAFVSCTKSDNKAFNCVCTNRTGVDTSVVYASSESAASYECDAEETRWKAQGMTETFCSIAK